MLSDVGIEQSVVQNERGDDRDFLDTAWTLHVGRGVLLWLFAVVLAWPASHFYAEPQLLYLLPVGALNVVVQGFASTSLFTLRRHLQVDRLMAVELFAQGSGLLVTIPWAWVSPSVWAIIAGGLAAALARTGASYYVDVGYRNRFGWDRSAIDAILEFGKWIFGSSMLFFVSRQGDRVLLGRFIGMGPLGVYSIAVFLSEALGMAVTKVTHGIFYPVFSEVRRNQPDRLREIYYKTRLRLDLLSLPALGFLTMTGSWIVELLYDDRYIDAGWMLEVLCVRVAMSCVLVPCETCLFSMGHTRYGFFQNVFRSLWIVIGVPLGWHFFGIEGVVWATALSEVPVWIVLWLPFARLGLLRPAREALALAAFAAGMLIGHLADPWLGWLVQDVLGG